MIDGNVPWRMHEAAVIQERGAAQFRYGNTPLSCGGREQNVQEERDVTRLSVKQTDREMEREREKCGVFNYLKSMGRYNFNSQ